MAKKGQNQHVVKREGGWAVRAEGNSRDTVQTDTQREAIERAREIARKQASEVVIHGRDGKIRERNSYGNDPLPPVGGSVIQRRNPPPVKISTPTENPPDEVLINEHIVVSPNVLHGKPRIAGSRIMVYQVLDLLSAGKTVEEITSEDYFPDISAEDVYACIEYASRVIQSDDIVPIQ